jgi:hypothetical protein
MLIFARNEHFIFRTALACAAVIFTSGVIAMSQQNMVGAGLILAPMFIMLLVTSLLPREDRSIESDAEAAGPQDHALLDPTPASPAGHARPLFGLATYAAAALVLAFVGEVALHRAMITRAAGHGKRELAGHRLSPYHAAGDLSDTIALRGRTHSDQRTERDDEADDGTINDALQASVEGVIPTADLDLKPEAESACLSPSGAGVEGAACDAGEGGR